jgi:hypothetical protein
MSFSVVASPQFEPANLTRMEPGKERLALHKNHEGLPKCEFAYWILWSPVKNSEAIDPSL